MINIQYQELGGVWVTVMTVDNEPIRILESMKALKHQMPDRRIRAVDSNGRLVDFL